MDIDRLPHVGRRAFFLGLLGGVAALAVGCGGDSNVSAPTADAAAKSKEKEEAERALREKAFGKSGVPGKTTTPKG